jgi:hypothetical protein
MSERTAVYSILIAVLISCVGGGTLAAQDAGPTPKNAAQEAVKARPEPPIEAYRLDFLISEMEDGKRINSRQYSMNLNTNDSNELKIGTREPVDLKEGDFQYLDLGMNIYARLVERGGQLELTARAENSNLVPPGGGESHPVVRQMKINASTIVTNGKPIVMGAVDDPNSKRQFQLEVTVTKLK